MNQEVKLKASGAKWYVEYTLNGKRVRAGGGHNRIKNPTEKLAKFKELQKEIQLKLKTENAESVTVSKMIDKMVAEKKRFQKKRSNAGLKKNLNSFKNFLIKTHRENLSPVQITKSIIGEYITNELERGCSNRTVNNYMIDVKSLFNYLINLESLDKSPCKGFIKLPERSEKNLAYSNIQVIDIKKWLTDNNRYLHLFCQFISYTFLRIEEIQNLKVKDVDLTRMFIIVPASGTKTSLNQTKKIMEPLQHAVTEMLKGEHNPEHYLFTTKRVPGPVRTGVNYWNKKFRLMKLALSLSDKHTMYGLRHTFVINLLENGASAFEIMNLTGHTTLSAFEKYIRDLKKQLPKDISNKFTINI